MTWEQIRESRDAGATLGLHTAGYVRASRVDPAESGIRPAFGYHSGPVNRRSNAMRLPRLPIVEHYADDKPFTLRNNTLALPVVDLLPDDPLVAASGSQTSALPWTPLSAASGG